MIRAAVILVTIVLITLKLCNVIDYDWIWVFCPALIYFVCWLVQVILGIIFIIKWGDKF